MEVFVEDLDGVTLLSVNGSVDSSTASILESSMVEVIRPNCMILMDMTQVEFMSSAGLRVMLLLYRKVSENEGNVILVGVADDIQDAMSATGFLKHFTLAVSVDEGLELLRV